MLGGIFFIFIQIAHSLCKETVETLIGRHILRRLVWVCTICQHPTKMMLGLDGLSKIEVGFSGGGGGGGGGGCKYQNYV